MKHKIMSSQVDISLTYKTLTLTKRSTDETSGAPLRNWEPHSSHPPPPIIRLEFHSPKLPLCGLNPSLQNHHQRLGEARPPPKIHSRPSFTHFLSVSLALFFLRGWGWGQQRARARAMPVGVCPRDCQSSRTGRAGELKIKCALI